MMSVELGMKGRAEAVVADGDTAQAMGSGSLPVLATPRMAALMEEAHRRAAALGAAYILVLGSEHYYPRAGYRPAEEFGVTVPEGIPSANFMVLKLREDAEPLNGAVNYAPEFGL